MSALERLVELTTQMPHNEWTELSLDWSPDYKWSCTIITGVPFGAVEEEEYETAEEAVNVAVEKALKILEEYNGKVTKRD